MLKKMNEQNFPATPIEIIDRLQQENKFSEAFIFAWGVTEFLMDTAVLTEYDLLENEDDPKRKVILDLNFNRKLELQTKLKVLTVDNAKIVRSLQEKRNKLFHYGGFFVPIITEDEKREIMRTAKQVIIIIADVATEAFNQKLKTEKKVSPNEP
jgi:hypothetical protein